MSTAESGGRGGTTTMVSPHATGHAWAKDGTLLRVDRERGINWVATRYDSNLHVIQEVRGSDAEVHRVVASWARVGEVVSDAGES